MLCFVVVMQSFIMNSHEVFIHIHQGCFAGTGAIARLPQCQWSKPDGYGKISQCITTTKHSKAKTVCIFLGIYCSSVIACSSSTAEPYYLCDNDVDVLVQERRNSSALAMELCLSCMNPLTWHKTLSTFLALCVGNPTFPAERVTDIELWWFLCW